MHDLVIDNALLVDGSGANRRPAAIAVDGGRIAAIGAPGTLGPTRRTIDAGGHVAAPGFIDVHTHDDRLAIAADMRPKVTQGVTTVVVGNCGISLAPLTLRGDPIPPFNLLGGRADFAFDSFAAYADRLAEQPPAVNVAALIGHSTLRVGAMPELDRKATAAELDAMQRRLDDSLAAGAVGFSTGLFYGPSKAADADEVAALAGVLKAHGGIYATHMRDEHDNVLKSLDETFSTAARAGAPVVVSHHKCAGPKNWGRSRETLPVIAAAAAAQPVGLDAYPYAAGSTVLHPDLVPGDIRIMVTWSTPHPERAGRDLAAIAADWGCDQKTAAARLLPAGAVYFQMAEEDVRRILAFPLTMIGSDGLPHDQHPHPRLWGTFPRVIGHYARELGLFTLETAIHKMTGLSAARFGLHDRGLLAPGKAADLVLFDPETIIDTATFDNPIREADGIDLVMVNGAIAWRPGAAEIARNGRLLRHTPATWQ